ncbi:glycosyltransferase family 87 protein [Rhodococcus sp. NPDC059969]|uniref:glycosyltransferase family 87 protein n=1 Tax=Rhodococcus sp. NPDC059969 TaxID=3347018 RepID=UPI003671E7B2
MRTDRKTPASILALVVGLCGLTMALGYFNKARCGGAPFAPDGRSLNFDVNKNIDVCYSDIQLLWLGRGIDQHLFPFVTGGITPEGFLTGGTVEYPVLSGILMWLGGIGSHTDTDFLLHSALILAPFGLLTAWMLGKMSGAYALVWSATPPLVLYAFHNWELPVVATSVGAIFLMTFERIPLRTRAILAAVILAIGFCLKLYPGMFVLPLMAYVLLRGTESKRYDVRGALMTAGAAIATVVLVNLPFALISYEGWRASFSFQEKRSADITTNSLWFWGLRPFYGFGVRELNADYDALVSILSPVMILASFALAMYLGWRRYVREGYFPWIAVSAAMLCGFVLLHKVNSPQYTLWILPFLVLFKIRWFWIVAYLIVDAALGIGIFRYFYQLDMNLDPSKYEAVVQASVWGHVILLAVFFFLFLRVPLRYPLAGGTDQIANSDNNLPTHSREHA